MAISDLAETVTPHESALVHITADADDTPLAGILPHGDIPAISQYRFFLCIHGNHQLVVIDLSSATLIIYLPQLL